MPSFIRASMENEQVDLAGCVQDFLQESDDAEIGTKFPESCIDLLSPDWTVEEPEPSAASVGHLMSPWLHFVNALQDAGVACFVDSAATPRPEDGYLTTELSPSSTHAVDDRSMYFALLRPPNQGIVGQIELTDVQEVGITTPPSSIEGVAREDGMDEFLLQVIPLIQVEGEAA